MGIQQTIAALEACSTLDELISKSKEVLTKDEVDRMMAGFIFSSDGFTVGESTCLQMFMAVAAKVLGTEPLETTMRYGLDMLDHFKLDRNYIPDRLLMDAAINEVLTALDLVALAGLDTKAFLKALAEDIPTNEKELDTLIHEL